MCRLVKVKTNFNTEVLVADIKKEYIEKIMSSASTCSAIKEIILFGSALAERCNDRSDIDIAVISDLSESKLYRSAGYRKLFEEIYRMDFKQDYDVIYMNEKSKTNKEQRGVYHDILNYGKTIYKEG